MFRPKFKPGNTVVLKGVPGRMTVLKYSTKQTTEPVGKSLHVVVSWKDDTSFKVATFPEEDLEVFKWVM